MLALALFFLYLYAPLVIRDVVMSRSHGRESLVEGWLRSPKSFAVLSICSYFCAWLIIWWINGFNESRHGIVLWLVSFMIPVFCTSISAAFIRSRIALYSVPVMAFAATHLLLALL